LQVFNYVLSNFVFQTSVDLLYRFFWLHFTSAKVMFSSALVCLLAGLRKNYSTDFHNI